MVSAPGLGRDPVLHMPGSARESETPRNMSVPNARGCSSRGAVPKQVQGHNTPHPTRPTLPTHTLPQLVTTTPSHNVTNNNGTPRNRNAHGATSFVKEIAANPRATATSKAQITCPHYQRLRHCPRQESPCFNYHKSLLVCNRSLSHTSAPHPRSSKGHPRVIQTTRPQTWISWSQFKLTVTCHWIHVANVHCGRLAVKGSNFGTQFTRTLRRH
jgi:hypothetical protein